MSKYKGLTLKETKKVRIDFLRDGWGTTTFRELSSKDALQLADDIFKALNAIPHAVKEARRLEDEVIKLRRDKAELQMDLNTERNPHIDALEKRIGELQAYIGHLDSIIEKQHRESSPAYVNSLQEANRQQVRVIKEKNEYLDHIINHARQAREWEVR